MTREWPEDVRLDRGSAALDGLRAFYLGFVTGLSVVPLCVQLGRALRDFWDLWRSTITPAATARA